MPAAIWSSSGPGLPCCARFGATTSATSRTYWEKFKNRYYVAGDSARRDKDGYYWIMGRIDDVLNIAGHRLGTMEIESALVAHPQGGGGRGGQQAARNQGRIGVCLRGAECAAAARAAAKALIEELRAWVGDQLSPIAKPDEIRLTDNLPKTRSGKIMRRLLRALARGEEITQDMSTLENPAILEQLRGVEPAAAKAAKVPKKPARAGRKTAKKTGRKTIKKPVRRASPAKRKAKVAAKHRKPAKAAARTRGPKARRKK